jgi:hypothetical protein
MIHGDNTKLMSFWHYRKIGDNLQRRALAIIQYTHICATLRSEIYFEVVIQNKFSRESKRFPHELAR